MALAPIRSIDPASSSAHTPDRAFKRALLVFKEAARRVPAYKDFLRKAGIRADRINTAADFALVPETDKPTYFSQYSLEDLSWDGMLAKSKYVSTSSGSTGVPFFWPRGETQDRMTGLLAENVFRRLFGAARGTTLFVNSFSLGTWIAGLEFFNAARFTIERGTDMTIVSPGIDKGEAVQQIRTLAPFYDRVVLAGYPPFIKDIIEFGEETGVRWSAIDLRLFFAGEAVSEVWKEGVLKRIGHPGESGRAINLYGMAEAGMTAHETPLSMLVRANLKAFSGMPDADEVMGLYQYYPTMRYFEVVEDHSLLLTANAGLPLIRYSTRDTGGIIRYADLKGLGSGFSGLARRARVDVKAWQLPFVYLYGRKDLSISLYAVNIYVENVKRALERSSFADMLSGLFIMSTDHADNLDQRFSLTVELSSRTSPHAQMTDALAKEIIATVRTVNSEYAKLYSVVGDKAAPHITLVPYGAIDTIPGRKHRWVRRQAATALPA